MRRDREDRNFVLSRPVVPKHPPGRRNSIFDVGLPNFLAVAALLVGVLMGMQARVLGIRLNQSEALPHSLQLPEVLLVPVVLKVSKLPLGLGLQNKLVPQGELLVLVEWVVGILGETADELSLAASRLVQRAI